MTTTKSCTTESGYYTPVLDDGSNVANYTAYPTGWSRVGDFVTVAGRFDIDPASTNTDTILMISIPVPSDIGAVSDAGGTAVSVSGSSVMSGVITGDIGNNQVLLSFYATSSSNRAWYFQFSYRVL